MEARQSTIDKYNSCIGQVFNRLTVVDRVTKNNLQYLVCVCSCGKETTITGADVVSSRTKSCGCLSIETATKRSTKHGMFRSLTYRSYDAMKSRCLHPNSIMYRRYGGRGIKICDRWLESFQNFLDDMGERPSKKYSLDRINNNGNYEPSNCKWATQHEQQRNRTGLVWLEHDGRRMIMQDWANELGINHCTLDNRIKSGWDLKTALTTRKIPTGYSLKQYMGGNS